MIYVGIDVAKDKHDCFAMNSDGEILIEKLTITNNLDGFETLYNSLMNFSDSLDNIKQGKAPIISPSEFSGKIVFVGANAKGAGLALADALPTPILHKHPGVDIQATYLDNLINKEFINQPPFVQDVLTIIILTIITFILVNKLQIFKSILSLTGIGFLYFVFTIICFENGIAPNVITPLAIQLITMI